MGNLYALIEPKGSTNVYLVSIDGDVQGQLGDIFDIYALQFSENIEEVLDFNIGYNPDPNQVVEMPLTPEMTEIANLIEAGPIGRERYDPNGNNLAGLRALLWAEENGGNRIFVQNFTRAQALSTKIGLIFDRETFRRIQEPAMLIASKIDAIISDGSISFKKFNVIKQVFDLTELYREATDQDIRGFFEHLPFTTDDVESFCESASITNRKLIFSISRSETLEHLGAEEIQNAAADLEINLEIIGNRIVLEEGRAATEALKFLDNSIYRSPLNNDRWVANSRRRLG